MFDFRAAWKQLIADTLFTWAHDQGLSLPQDFATVQDFARVLPVENPPKPDMGDLAFPLFAFAKVLRKGPPQISSALVPLLGGKVAEYTAGHGVALGFAEAAGPYINVRLDKTAVTKAVLAAVEKAGAIYGNSSLMAGQRILVEFSSPNTNKPLHLGHLRNNALGESTSRILKASGAEVKKVNLFNNRGIHICKSMLAYQRWGEDKDPAALGLKTDHYVAQLYVRYQNELKTQVAALKLARPELAAKDDDDIWLETEIGAAAQNMLRAWEAGDPATRALWEKMNAWAVTGIMQTYTKTGVSFDWIQYEHETYLLGKAEVLKGLEKGAFFKLPDGAVAVELPWSDGAKTADGSEPPKARKVVLRADGTSIYLTQDLGTAIHRNEEWPFDQAVYVVASEQDYHFKVLFHCLKTLGYPWAEKLHHLSYGLVNLPTGRMKTREGTVVDADDLLDELASGAAEEIKQKGREDDVSDVRDVSYKVALAALHYFLLQADPAKDMIFNPQESLSFSGNTGPYLQYMGARSSSLFRKWERAVPSAATVDAALLPEDQAWDLVKLIESYPSVVEQSARDLNPSHLAAHVYELARAFSRFWDKLPVLKTDNQAVGDARYVLTAAVQQVLNHAFSLLNIPFLESM